MHRDHRVVAYTPYGREDHPERDDAMGDLYYSFIEDYETAKEL